MKRNLMFLVVLLVALPTFTFSQMEPGSPAQARIQKEVRHELLMLPYFGVFDNIEYRVDGETVTLLGDVTRPTLKSDAENVVKRIEGPEWSTRSRSCRRLRWTTDCAWPCIAPSTDFRPWRNMPWAYRNQSASLLRTAM